jgi:hypothetical protein
MIDQCSTFFIAFALSIVITTVFLLSLDPYRLDPDHQSQHIFYCAW